MFVRALAAVGVAAGLCGLANGHGSLLYPPPRNGVEKSLPEFANGSFPATHCEHALR
jgi:hypothetical protein